MSSLQRYRKPGGFLQLVSLIETFGPAKREKFLEMIEDESAAWAQTLREKMLTLDRLDGWPDELLCKILRQLPPKSQTYALEAFAKTLKVRVFAALSAVERRRLTEILGENKPKADEIASVGTKFLEIARRMLLEREISAERIDATLLIPEGIESRLDGGAAPVIATAVNHVSPARAPISSDTEPKPPAAGDVTKLKSELKASQRENQTLRDEVLRLREKLDLVRRAAA